MVWRLLAVAGVFLICLCVLPGAAPLALADPDPPDATKHDDPPPAKPDGEAATPDASDAQDAPAPLGEPVSGQLRRHNSVEYTVAGVANRALHMDIVLPPEPAATKTDDHTDNGDKQAAPADGPYPTLLLFHGGSFMAGDPGVMRDLAERIARYGFVCASVEYRLVPYQLPDMVNDAKTAVRFLRGNAARYHVDPLNIGAVGHSAGGSLSLMLAVTGNEPAREKTGGYREQSSVVQAGISLAGVSDFGRDVPEQLKQLDQRLPARDFLCGDDGVEKASPARLIQAGDAPLLLIHGTADNVVPPAQSEMVEAACKKAGVPCRYVKGEGWGHNFIFRGESRDRTVEEIVRFLRKHLTFTEDEAEGDF